MLNLSSFEWISHGALTFDTYEWSISYDPNRMFTICQFNCGKQTKRFIAHQKQTNETERNSHFHRRFDLTVFADQTPVFPINWQMEEWRRVFFCLFSSSFSAWIKCRSVDKITQNQLHSNEKSD